MRKNKSSSRAPSLRGSVTQNNISVRIRGDEDSRFGFAARLGLLAGVLLIAVVIAVFAWRAGWPQQQAEKVRDAALTLTQKAQFAVKDITVEGRRRASKSEIFDALGTERGAPILDLDAQAAAARLAKLPWVASATVERRLPDTIFVSLTEREPVARWQHDDHVYVIDVSGQILPSAQPEEFPGLPLVVGAGAADAAQDLLALLKTYPDIQEKVESAVRVGERRWDLHLQSKIIIRLPEDDVDQALHRLSVLMTQDKILDRDIVAVDLRMPDRLVIEPAAAVAPAPTAKPPVKPTGHP